MYTIESLSGKLIEEACMMNASDIHIVPGENDAVIRFRIDDELFRKHSVTRNECARLISHFKFLSSMDIGERRQPQSGALTLHVKNRPVHLRMSTLPTIHEESLVIRILSQTSTQPLAKLSLFPSATAKLLSFLKHSHGLMIFTGPTGSGKTTTLYSLIEYAKRHFNRNIITLEDPVESRSENVLQVQVNEKAGMTYSAGLKAVLRHDPDMIILGEIRDAETAKIAVRAALTGHLVLSSMHAKNAKGAIYRLLELGIDITEIEQTLIAVSAQRLVGLTCPFCGDRCSLYCRLSRSVRRASIFELLYGKSLQLCVKEARGEYVISRTETLKLLIRKGIALGYLPSEAYERWVYDETD
ncbi:competence type IV pilus ATPase ComGA [Bacillus swezeyi]|uniref:Competence protein ComG n=1 Tax=Bacillus swezeyi TaxID=1925020 RepID=A0A1R1QB25_9BACI|nr:competence type IV pilus ATPase ComGA [Bacillus swezeyi]MEC1261159.1 competence type IV pilus ATPase ComGA [Bacillus swezeyi]MED2929370.1 competence type IV pilus ATPase ComGA [Bacillus swezeyi]MED2963603.1 competence type IV pilus ATPase ComGA [Bacillus swezeyi]MED3073691.1 competence type IV pilus ATPase ComGA [Bacillus swezeyi]MED3081951.1 competence type IV pilus ATPase ComGA [Bacillus swezeyi]